jgi:xylan 1,4-beta-xylosidase
LVPSAASAPARLHFAHLRPGKYRLRLFRTGYRHNDAYSAYIDMGMPKQLTAVQVDQLQALTRDRAEIDRWITISPKGSFDVNLPMRTNDILLVRLERAAGREGKSR